MKIVHTVESYPPAVCGMAEVVRQLSERLAAAGHEVTVAAGAHPDRRDTVINGVRVVSFHISGNAVRGYHGSLEHYQKFLMDFDCDVMTHFAAQQWATDLALPLLPRIRAKKQVFVPTGFSALHEPAYSGYFEQMKGWLRQYDATVFHSNNYRDIEFARACGATKLSVIPNGADEREFLTEPTIDIRARLGIPPGRLVILHVGSHTGVKGHAEAIKIFRRARLRDATLVIVGRKGQCERSCRLSALAFRVNPMSVLKRKRLVVVRLSRPETVAAHQGADLFLFPSNIECSPIVLFESMASRTPFLTTDVGNAREIVEWSGGGVLLPTETLPGGNSKADIGGSARLLEELAADPERRHDLAENGFRAWQDRFTWRRIADQYQTLYDRLLASGAPE